MIWRYLVSQELASSTLTLRMPLSRSISWLKTAILLSYYKFCPPPFSSRRRSSAFSLRRSSHSLFTVMNFCSITVMRVLVCSSALRFNPSFSVITCWTRTYNSCTTLRYSSSLRVNIASLLLISISHFLLFSASLSLSCRRLEIVT